MLARFLSFSERISAMRGREQVQEKFDIIQNGCNNKSVKKNDFISCDIIDLNEAIKLPYSK